MPWKRWWASCSSSSLLAWRLIKPSSARRKSGCTGDGEPEKPDSAKNFKKSGGNGVYSSHLRTRASPNAFNNANLPAKYNLPAVADNYRPPLICRMHLILILFLLISPFLAGAHDELFDHGTLGGDLGLAAQG